MSLLDSRVEEETETELEQQVLDSLIPFLNENKQGQSGSILRNLASTEFEKQLFDSILSTEYRSQSLTSSIFEQMNANFNRVITPGFNESNAMLSTFVTNVKGNVQLDAAGYVIADYVFDYYEDEEKELMGW
jgi:ATP-dependent protease HslVU (ClpYQ) ATPase subunit